MKLHRVLAATLVALLGFAVPVRANEVTSTQQYQSGQIVQSSDLSGDIEAVRNLSGILATLLLGNANALPANNPLAVTLSNSAMTFTIGGSGQFVIAQDVVTSGNARVIDSCPFQTITIPANSTGSARTDLLSIQYQQISSNGHTVAFSDGSNRTVYKSLEGCAYTYSVGTTTAPAGYVGFARIVVPAGATTASQATVTYLFGTVGSLLASELGGIVTSFNGLSGAITAVGGTGITLTPSGNTITIATSAPLNPVSSLNGLQGALTLDSPGGALTITPSGSTIHLAVNFPAAVNTLNSFSGTVTVTSGTGISVSNSSGTITIGNTGVTSILGGTGITPTASTGAVTLNGFYSGFATHIERGACAASTAASSGYWYCQATLSGSFTSTATYVCTATYVTGSTGSAGIGAGTGYIILTNSTVDLYQNANSGGVVQVFCLGY